MQVFLFSYFFRGLLKKKVIRDDINISKKGQKGVWGWILVL